MPSELILNLQRKISHGLGPLLSGRKVALFDFPYHANCGDHAIWLGVEQAVQKLQCSVVYRADYLRYRSDFLKALPSDVVVVINGGGNLGDLWPETHEFREQIIMDSKGRSVVQLPQSAYFKSQDRLNRFKRIVEAHGNVTIFLRDQRSLDYIGQNINCAIGFLPDMALMIGKIVRPVTATTPVMTLARTDKEANDNLAVVADSQGFPIEDWVSAPVPGPLSASGQIGRAVGKLAKSVRPSNPIWALSTAGIGSYYKSFAYKQVLRGSSILAKGNVVLTDRLHAHILSELMEIPHVAVDTGYGKISGVHDAWLRESQFAHIATSTSEACEIAHSLSGGLLSS